MSTNVPVIVAAVRSPAPVDLYGGRMRKKHFWSLVQKGNDCWIWQGATRRGYGKYGKHGVAAHRVMWTLIRGPIPEGLHVLHRCDTPLCVRPDHLFLGTHAINHADKAQKGRAKRISGGRARLTPADWQAAKAHLAAGESCAAVAKRYGVTRQAIVNRLRREKTA